MLTYSLTITLDIVTVGWAFCLIDVWKNTDTCLIHAHQILSAWCSITYQTIFGVVSSYGRSTCRSVQVHAQNEKLSTQFGNKRKISTPKPFSPALIFDSFD